MKASEIRALLKLLDQPDVISFAGGIPDPALFPATAAAAAYAAALASTADAAAALQYSASEGAFYHDGASANTMRLSISLPTPERITDGIGRLAALL
jgi:DNA-binding transcriptional MocR family regulator